MPPANPVIAILGATGTGKSQLAVDLAARFNGEVINADAMQLYTGLPVLTNKLAPAQQRAIPHHLLDCIPLSAQPWRVDRFVREARRVIADVHARGRVPVVVGGTHYYVQSLLWRGRIADKAIDDDDAASTDDALPRGNTAPTDDAAHTNDSASANDKPPTDDTPRPELEGPTEALYARLREVDPVMAARWHPADRRKIRRSLEIWLTTGRRASDVYAEQAEARRAGDGGLVYPTLFLWADATRDVLRERLDTRVEVMVAAGLVDEVRELQGVLAQLRAGGDDVDITRGIWVSIGFKEFCAYADAVAQGTPHDTALAQAMELTRIATRQYAKSQIRWIRIKLLLALQQARALDRLFLVDTTDAARWNDAILEPSCRLAAAFLRDAALPSPVSLSPRAAEMLTPAQPYDVGQRPDLWRSQTCDVCRVTAVTEREWQQHVQGSRHKKLVKKSTARTARAAAAAAAGDD